MAIPVSHARTERLEALLRERQLDRTLTTTRPPHGRPGHVAAFGLPALDGSLAGGVPRGQVSELVGPVSSGRTTLAWTWLAEATRRGESAALVDTFDRFDPATGEACGITLSRLLWIRGQALTKTASAIDPAWLPGVRAVDGPGTLLERTIDRALKALNLVLQSGVCTAVVLDLVDVPAASIRRIPPSTWLRLQRIVEGTDIACLLVGATPLARSAGGVVISTAPPAGAATGPDGAQERRAAGSAPHPSSASRAHARWTGTHDRARRLAGLDVVARVSSARRLVSGTAALQTITRHDAWARE